MAGDLLQTKLYVPQLRPSLIPRPHLIEKLNQSLQFGYKLVLISAPAGFGKTTLVSEWIQQCCQPLAWLSLDENDNDLTRFLTYLIAALQSIESNIGQSVLAALHSPEEINVEIVLTTLLNDIAELSDDVVLVLDDYHVIESPPIDQVIAFLLGHLPPQMHLVMASRIDPSLPLSRLRAQGQMIEIRAHDLRFTLEETAVFLNQSMGFNLSAPDIAALEMRTEGWIAGLQLAALAMQGTRSIQDSEQSRKIATFINKFTGSDRYIQDYLADEVLEQRPQGTRDFLLQTSILRRLSAPLCNAVTGKNGSQTILDTLESANLFIVPLDNERRWFRYHHLFADLLKHRLNQTFPNQISDLHRRASSWYEQANFINDAIYHAQAAQNNERVFEIIEAHWQNLVHQGDVIKLKHWLDSLGPAYTKKSAPLSMAYCWIHIFTGASHLIPDRIKDIQKLLQNGAKLEDAQLPMKLAVIPSLVETIEATIALDQKRARKAKAHAQKAISLIPNSPDPAARMLLQGAASYRLALAHRELGEYDQAGAVFLEGLEMLKASQNYFGMAATLLPIVAMYQESGKTRKAIQLCKNTLDFFAEAHLQKTAPMGIVKVVLASLQVDSSDFVAAQKNLEHGRQLVAQINSPQIHNLVTITESKLNKMSPPFQPLIEPLSPRELEVLQMLALGLTNREISERLFLALDTVKGHNRRIFGKLGVKNRTQAINKATSLKIIASQ